LPISEARFPKMSLLGCSVDRGKLLSNSRHKHPIEKAKIVHLAHALGFAWLHYTAVEPQPAGESGRERRTEYMSAQENKALARRSWEIVTETNLDTLEEALKEVYADTFVMHEPDEDVRGIEGLTQFVSMIRSAIPDLRVTLEDNIAEGEKVVSRWRAQGTHQGELMGIAATGNEVAITGITIHRIEEGKIVEEWENWDALGLMQQIGAVPSPEEQAQA
jgi:steroid delta-isomerase-like uncharacterized protein